MSAAPEDFAAIADAWVGDLPDLPEPEATPETPEGLLRQVLEEVRGLREDVWLARHGVEPRPKGEGWVLMRNLSGKPIRWVKRPANWGQDEASPQEQGPSDGQP
jgi:hypothetical protein